MKIRLVKNGIFPLLRGLDGNLLDSSPNTGYPLAGTIQGEGKLAGIPVIFIRTAGCNLRCSWIDDLGRVDICDTPYSSHNVYDTEDWEVEDVVRMVELNLGNMKHVVISGGEPTIQPAPLVNLVNNLKKKLGVHISIETNGVHYVPEITWKVDFFSISPKLKSSEPSEKKNKLIEQPVDDHYIRDHAHLRRNTHTIQKYINACYHMESYYGDSPDTELTRRDSKDFQLKFVIAREEDEKEIKKDFLSKLGLFRNEDILV
ncbi:MAG: 7-carboxy-7-deazaguanine synthase QueE, partial [Bacteroidales bacterium]